MPGSGAWRSAGVIADANFVLDILVADRHRHGTAVNVVKKLRRKRRRAEITAATVHEIVYVLAAPVRRNGFGLPRSTVTRAVSAINEESSFDVSEKRAVHGALKLYADGKLDFHDCYLLALAGEGKRTLLSFDRDLIDTGRVDPLISGGRKTSTG